MVLDKKFNLVLTNEHKRIDPILQQWRFQLRKFQLNRQKRINTYCCNGFGYYISSSYIKQEQKRNGSRCIYSGYESSSEIEGN